MSIAGTIFLVWLTISPLVAMILLRITPPHVALGLLATPYVGLALCALLWWFIRDSATPTRRADLVGLDPFETAYLGGGEKLAVDATIAGLVHRKVLAVDASERRLLRGKKQLESPHPLEQAVYSAIGPEAGQSIDEVRSGVCPVFDQIRDRLIELGLIMSKRGTQILGFMSGLVLLGNILISEVYLCGVVIYAKQCGLDEWLITGGLIYQVALSLPILIGFYFVIVMPTELTFKLMDSNRNRSRTGDEVLHTIKGGNAALELIADQKPEKLAGDDLVMAMGLFDKKVPVDGIPVELWDVLDSGADGDSDGNGEESDGDGFDAFGD